MCVKLKTNNFIHFIIRKKLLYDAFKIFGIFNTKEVVKNVPMKSYNFTLKFNQKIKQINGNVIITYLLSDSKAIYLL